MDRSSIMRLAILGYMARIQKQVVGDGYRLLVRAFRFRNLSMPALMGLLLEDADVRKRNLRGAAVRPFEHYRATFHEGRPHDAVDVERCVGSRVRTRYQYKMRSSPDRSARDLMSSKYQGQVAIVPKGERQATLEAIAHRAERLGQDGRTVDVQDACISRAELLEIVDNPSRYVRRSNFHSFATMVVLFTAADILARAIPRARESIRRYRSDSNKVHPLQREMVRQVAQDVWQGVLSETFYSLADAALALSGHERARLALHVLPIIQHKLEEHELPPEPLP